MTYAILLVGASRFVASIPTPEAKKFTADYKAKYKSNPEKYAQAGYDCAKMIAQAISKADSTDRDKVRDALAKTNYKGPQGKAVFDAKNQLMIDEYIVMVKDGEIKVVAGPISGK